MPSAHRPFWRPGIRGRCLALLAAVALVWLGELGTGTHAANAVSRTASLASAPPAATGPNAPALPAAPAPPAASAPPAAPAPPAATRPNAPAPVPVAASSQPTVRAAAAQPASTAPPAPTPTPSHVSPSPAGYGCQSALAYLATHTAPGFQIECPGYSLGHQAMTCVNVAGVCPGGRLITITDPCPAAYENEASNSWVVLGLRQSPIDPYGFCS